MGVDRRRWFTSDGGETSEDDVFEDDFQRFMHGETSVRPLNEEIERLYRKLKPHTSRPCPHGRTYLTCPQCYVNSDKGYL